MEDGGNDPNKYRALTFCQCLPQCESLKYEIELVKTNYKTHLTDYMTIASLKVFFKDSEFVPLKRFQLYGTVDFLANCGIIVCFEQVSKLLRIEINFQVDCWDCLSGYRYCQSSRFSIISSCGKHLVVVGVKSQ